LKIPNFSSASVNKCSLLTKFDVERTVDYSIKNITCKYFKLCKTYVQQKTTRILLSAASNLFHWIKSSEKRVKAKVHQKTSNHFHTNRKLKVEREREQTAMTSVTGLPNATQNLSGVQNA
jgi:hypothetical protein